jgi:thioredoxin-related protein
MFKKLLSLFALTTLALSVQAEKLWETDLSTALKTAKTEKKLVLVDFTGSDWCPWCIKLHKEVFDKAEFTTYAKTNFVLVEIDFPRTKAQPAEEKKANQALANKYKIEGYPTVVILDDEGKELKRLGYQPGGPKPFIEKLSAIKK